jgi:predicted esterase
MPPSLRKARRHEPLRAAVAVKIREKLDMVSFMTPFHPTQRPRIFRNLIQLCCAALAGMIATVGVAQNTPNHWWSGEIEAALSQSDTNRAELEKALETVSENQRDDLQFLLTNMPESDLQTLSAAFLLENIKLAEESFADAPWHDRVPKDIFLNDILPYASVNEQREDWREKLREKCLPLIADCKTPAEAVQRLNEKLFPLVHVKYSTERKKADQSPSETMDTGLASCTGLSILLIDACRAVGVPARLAGTPMWVNMRGNHTWIEVWDGDWHFTGAAEPDPKGQLDHTWFQHDASQALWNVPEHAIYATSFRKTGLSFPLDWAPELHTVSAVNVTERYTPNTVEMPADKARLQIEILDHLAGNRVPAQVTVANITNETTLFFGTSHEETADKNDFLTFDVPRGGTYEIKAEYKGQSAGREVVTGTNSQMVVVVSMSDTPLFRMPSQACYLPPPVTKTIKPAEEKKLEAALAGFFAATPEQQAKSKFSRALERLLRNDEPAVRAVAWKTYLAAPIHQAQKEDFDARRVRFETYESPYTVKTVGIKPANGWALFIAMHGGGGAPQEVNDSQWKIMQHYYKDHPEAGGYIYLALRAPNNTWNGFYDDYVYPLIDNLVKQFLAFGEVNPNKVFIMGYSHGGYGAFAIGPKEPDLFAAIHASAGAPTDGETTGKTLRNTIFTCMVGEKDTMYDRFERNRKFKAEIETLRAGDSTIYPVTVQIIPGNGHTGLPDRDEIKEMYPAVRNPVPRELTWLMTDGVIKDFFWIRTDAPGKKEEIDATCHQNHVTVTTTPNVSSVSVLLDARLIDFSKPVTVEINGQSFTKTLQPSLRTLAETLLRRGDPDLAFTAEVKLPIAPAAK